LAASEGNHGGHGIAEDATNMTTRYKTREPIEVVKPLESCHYESVTDFAPKGNGVFIEELSVSRSEQGKNHPLKNAKNVKKELGEL